jgi:hypothetical protein
MRNTFILFVLGFFFFPLEGKAQLWEYKINAGYSLGGSSPVSFPAEIRKIEEYRPDAWAPHIALEATRWLNEKWGIVAQIAWDHKGFTVRDRVKNMYTEIEIEGNPEPQTGNFTGNNTTKVQNDYLSVPLLATCRFSDGLTGQFGIYVAWLSRSCFKGSVSDGYLRLGSPVGEKIDVPSASFNFSKEQNRFDYGLLLAEEWTLYRNFALRGQLSWGLSSLFPSDFTGISFDMHNIYGMLGVSYRIPGRQ